MGLFSRRGNKTEQERSWVAEPYWGTDLSVLFNGVQHPLTGASLASTPQVHIDDNFAGMVKGVHDRFGVVSAAVFTRALLLSQVRFRWRNEATGRVFGNRDLAKLERPGSMPRPDLLTLAEYHVSYAGNAFFYDAPGGIRLLRPDWVLIVLGTNREMPADADLSGLLDAEVVGYQYLEGGDPKRALPLDPSRVAHWMPEPDPLVPWRGTSWIRSVLTEIKMGEQAERHMGKYLENGATPNVVHTFPNGISREQVESAIELHKAEYSGAANAYKTMFLMAGADTKVVGANPTDLALSDLHGHVETRVSSRSRVPAVVLGIREGMQGSALNSGNYQQTRRLFADGWFTPTVQNLCACLEKIMNRPADSELWYDPGSIYFLQEDQRDTAEIMQMKAAAIRQLVDAGFDPDQVATAVDNDDIAQLVGAHTGLTSVQLVPPDIGGNSSE